MDRMERPDPGVPSGAGSLPPGMQGMAPTPRTAAETAEVRRRRISGITETAPPSIQRPAPTPPPIPTPEPGALQYQQQGLHPYQQQPQGLWGSDPEGAEELLDFAHGAELLDLPALGYEIKRGAGPFVQGLVQQAKNEGKKLTLKALRRYLTKKVAKAVVPAAAGSVFGPGGTAVGGTVGTALGIGSTAWDALRLGGRLAKGGWQNIPRANLAQRIGRGVSAPIAATAGAARIGEGVLSGDPLGVGLGLGEIGLGVALPAGLASTARRQAARTEAGEGAFSTALEYLSGTPSAAAEDIYRRVPGAPTPSAAPTAARQRPARPSRTGSPGQAVVDEAQRPTALPGDVAPTARVTDLGLTVPTGKKPREAFRRVLRGVVEAAAPEEFKGRGVTNKRADAIIREAKQDPTGNSQASQWVKDALATHYNVTPEELVAPVPGRKRKRKPKSPPVTPEVPEAAALLEQPAKIPYDANPETAAGDSYAVWQAARELVGTEGWKLVDPTGPQGPQNVNRLAHQILNGDLKGADLSPEDMRAAQQAILDRVAAGKTRREQVLRGEQPTPAAARVAEEVVEDPVVEAVTAAPEAPAAKVVPEGGAAPIAEGAERLALPKGAASVGDKSGIFQRMRQAVATSFEMPTKTRAEKRALNQLAGQILTRPENAQQLTLRNQIIREVMGEGALVEAPKVPKVREKKPPPEDVVAAAGDVVDADVVPPPPETGAAARVVSATPKQLDELDTRFEQLATDIRNLADEELPEELADVRSEGAWDEVLERAVDRTRHGVEGAQHPAAATVAARTRLLEIAEELIDQSDALDTEAQTYVRALRDLHDDVGEALPKVDAPPGPARVPETDPPTAGEAALRAVPPEYTAKQLQGRSKQVQQLRKDYLSIEGATKKTWNAAKKGDLKALRSVNTTLARAHDTAATGEVAGPARQLGKARGPAEIPTAPEQLAHLRARGQQDVQDTAQQAADVAGMEEVAESGQVLSDVPTMVARVTAPSEAIELQVAIRRSINTLKAQLANLDSEIQNRFPDLRLIPARQLEKTTSPELANFRVLRQGRLDLRKEIAAHLRAERALEHNLKEPGFFERSRSGDIPGPARLPATTRTIQEREGLDPTVPNVSPALADKLRELVRSKTFGDQDVGDRLLDSIRRYAEYVGSGVTGSRFSIQALLKERFENLALHLIDPGRAGGHVFPTALDRAGAKVRQRKAKAGRFTGKLGPTETERYDIFASYQGDAVGQAAADDNARRSLSAAFKRIQQEGPATGEVHSPFGGRDADDLVDFVTADEAPEEAKRIWEQFVQMHWARQKSLEVDLLVQGALKEMDLPRESWIATNAEKFNELYEGSINEVTRWANALATSQMPGVTWKPSTKATTLRQEKAVRGLWGHPTEAGKPFDIKTPRANLTAWRDYEAGSDVAQRAADTRQAVTVERMGKELTEYLEAVNKAVTAHWVGQQGGTTLDALLFAGRAAARIGLTAAGGQQGWEQGGEIAEEANMGPVAAGTTRGITTALGAGVGAALPSYLAPRIAKTGTAALHKGVKTGAWLMNWLLSSPRSIAKAWMGAHNGALFAATERTMEGGFEWLGSFELQRRAAMPGVTKAQKRRATDAMLNGKKMMAQGMRIFAEVGKEDLRFAANLVPKKARGTGFDAFAEKSLIKQFFGIDVTTPEGKAALRPLSVQFSKMSDAEFEELLESDRLDGRLTNAIIGRLFRASDWAFQKVMVDNGVPFEKARQYTLTGKLDTEPAQIAMDWFQPRKGASAPGTAFRKLLSPVPRVGLQALERGIERTTAPAAYLANRAMGRNPRPTQTFAGKLSPKSIPEALSRLATGAAGATVGAMGADYLDPRLQPFLSAGMGPVGAVVAGARGAKQAAVTGKNMVMGGLSSILREGAPIELEGQTLPFNNLFGELTRLGIVPSALRDYTKFGDIGAPEGRQTSGPQLAAAMGSGQLDPRGGWETAGGVVGKALTAPYIGGPQLAGVAGELLAGLPAYRSGLPPKPLVNLNAMGQEAFPAGGMPSLSGSTGRGWQEMTPPSLEEKVGATQEFLAGPEAQPTMGTADALKLLAGQAVGGTLFPTYQHMRPAPLTGVDPVLKELSTWGAADLVAQRGLPGLTPDSTAGGGLRDPVSGAPVTIQRRGRELSAAVAGQEFAEVYQAVQRMMASGEWQRYTPEQRRYLITGARRGFGTLPGSEPSLVAQQWRRNP
jgi:hypothetical protein